MSLNNMTTEDLKKLYGYKTSWETADDTQKNTLKGEATALRAGYGISQDTATADQVKALLDQRESASVTLPVSNMMSSNQMQTDPTEQRIKDLIASQKAQQQAELTAARDRGLSSLTKEKETIAPKYYNDRNAIASTADQEAKRLTEMMAKSGLAGSGASGQLLMQNRGQMQGDLSKSKTAESNAFADIEARTTDLNNQYQTGLAGANAQSDIAMMQALIDQSNNNRNYNLQEAGLMGVLNGKQTLAGQQSAAQISNTNAQTANIAANTAYQQMVNSGYPTQQAAQIAQLLASTESIKLGNEAQSIANQYAPQIAQGQLDGQALQNAYQKLINAGYPAQQAAQIAATYANIAQGNAQIAISQQNANLNQSQFDWQKQQQQSQFDWQKEQTQSQFDYQKQQDTQANSPTNWQNKLNALKSGYTLGNDGKLTPLPSTVAPNVVSLAYEEMIRSGNPIQWLEENKQVFNGDELKTLRGYLSSYMGE